MLGLPSLHTLDHAQGARIWYATEAADRAKAKSHRWKWPPKQKR
jgi:hypothetical protein